MKIKKSIKSLVLNKETIACLSFEDMEGQKAGEMQSTEIHCQIGTSSPSVCVENCDTEPLP